MIPLLEECWERPLTEKERQLVSILEVVQIEKFAGRLPRRFGRKPKERQALARALVAKAVYNHPHTRATIEALRAAPVFRRLCGFVRRSDIPSEATFRMKGAAGPSDRRRITAAGPKLVAITTGFPLRRGGRFAKLG